MSVYHRKSRSWPTYRPYVIEEQPVEQLEQLRDQMSYIERVSKLFHPNVSSRVNQTIFVCAYYTYVTKKMMSELLDIPISSIHMHRYVQLGLFEKIGEEDQITQGHPVSVFALTPKGEDVVEEAVSLGIFTEL